MNFDEKNKISELAVKYWGEMNRSLLAGETEKSKQAFFKLSGICEASLALGYDVKQELKDTLNDIRAIRQGSEE